MDWPRVIGFIEICLSFSVSAAFVIVYAMRNRWWGNATGRGFMAMMSTLALTLGLTIVGQIVSLHAGPQPVGCVGASEIAQHLTLVRLVVFGLVPVTLAWPLLALLRRRPNRNNSPREQEEADSQP